LEGFIQAVDIITNTLEEVITTVIIDVTVEVVELDINADITVVRAK
jgi:hypothetical protein